MISSSPSLGKLYASVPSSVGSGGNSITTIDPATGTVETSVFVGSEPNRLALSDDGHSLYVNLDGAFAIRRFDASTQTPGLQFSVGQDSFFGRYGVTDVAVAPGNPNLVAIARLHPGISPPAIEQLNNKRKLRSQLRFQRILRLTRLVYLGREA